MIDSAEYKAATFFHRAQERKIQPLPASPVMDVTPTVRRPKTLAERAYDRLVMPALRDFLRVYEGDPARAEIVFFNKLGHIGETMQLPFTVFNIGDPEFDLVFTSTGKDQAKVNKLSSGSSYIYMIGQRAFVLYEHPIDKEDITFIQRALSPTIVSSYIRDWRSGKTD